MNYLDKINIINCESESRHKFNKNEIAFAIYSNVLAKDIPYFCNRIYELLEMGKWISKEQHINFYVVENSLEILKLENKNSYNKSIYIMDENISNENIKVTDYRKMYDINEKKETILGYTSCNCTIYSCYERKLNKSAKLNPYGSPCFYDIDKLVNEDIFFKIEEIFAKEDYRRNLVSLYRKYFGRDNEISSDLGFEYCSIKNDITTNKDIIRIINNNFKTNLNKSLFEDYKIENHMKAFIEIFKVIYDDKLHDESINELEKYISEIESELGNYIKIYSIEEEGNHINTGYSVNSFYINFRTWCVVYQNAILIISYGSDE